MSRELNQRADELAKGAALEEYDRRAEVISVTEQNVLNGEQVCTLTMSLIVGWILSSYICYMETCLRTRTKLGICGSEQLGTLKLAIVYTANPLLGPI